MVPCNMKRNLAPDFVNRHREICEKRCALCWILIASRVVVESISAASRKHIGRLHRIPNAIPLPWVLAPSRNVPFVQS